MNQVTVTTKSPEIARDVLDAVDSPWVTCDLDPANWITLDNVFETGAAIEHMFDVLGGHIISGHAKEVVMEDRHSIHITWGSLGDGYLHFKTYLRRMEALEPS